MQMLGGDDDDGFAFDDEEEVKGFSGGGMHQTAKVSIDRDSGQISGWDSIWNLIRDENERKVVNEDTGEALAKKI